MIRLFQQSPFMTARALLLVLVAALSACASLEPAQEGEAVQRQAAASFELSGRLAAGDGEHAANGRLHWKHAAAQDVMTFFNPLGQIAARLVVDAQGGAIVRTADGRVHRADDADTLAPALLGVDVPLDALPQWVQAVTRDNARVLRRDPVGRPERISDQGWILDYSTYADDTPTAHPIRLQARRGEASLRLIIDEWTARP